MYSSRSNRHSIPRMDPRIAFNTELQTFNIHRLRSHTVVVKVISEKIMNLKHALIWHTHAHVSANLRSHIRL
jgi:hypothetical protein